MNITGDEQKTRVANYALDYLVEKKILHSGMKIGLGTGSTAIKVAARLAELLQEGVLKNIATASTSFQTTILCEHLGIPVYSLNSKQIACQLDFTIDGADEIDAQKNLTKGGGASLLQEKILAYNSQRYFIVATENKCVQHLGISFPIPVEVIPEARGSCARALQELGAETILREGVKKMGPVVTDNGNFILDARFSAPFDPKDLEPRIKLITGVVEVGLFTKLVPTVFLCGAEGSCRMR